jgi:hypothetical protein
MTHQMRTSRLVRTESNRTSAVLVLLPQSVSAVHGWAQHRAVVDRP